MQESGEITVLLQRWKDGDREALAQLVPHVYPHLHDVAAAYLRRESGGHTLQPTALVNELYLKLMKQRKADWADRGHFYAFAAKVMRQILVDHGRKVHTEKRGGGMEPVPLSEELAWVNLNSGDMIDVNRALDELEAVDARKVRLAELYFFLGCTAAESASLLGISASTAERDLLLLRSWLYARLNSRNVAPASDRGETP